MATDALSRSIVKVTGPATDQEPFGTGFVCALGDDVAYIVTCQHVVDAIPAEQQDGESSRHLRVDGHPAEVIAHSCKYLDLAVLRVSGLTGRDPLPLKVGAATDGAFRTRGFFFRADLGQGMQDRSLDGRLGDENGLDTCPADEHANGERYRVWEYRIDRVESVTGGGEDWFAKVKDGYSGAPVVAGGGVVAVLNTAVGSDKGYAMDIRELPRAQWDCTPEERALVLASLRHRSIPIHLLATSDAGDEAAQVRRALAELPAQLELASGVRLDIVDGLPSVGVVAGAPITLGILGWEVDDKAPWEQLVRAGDGSVFLYRREGRPPLDQLADDALDQAFTHWQAFKAWADGLAPPCAEPPVAGACWRRFAPEQASALAQRVVGDLKPVLTSFVRKHGDGPEEQAASAGTQRRWAGPPYLGLVALRNTDWAIFFGRDAEVDRLLARLREPNRRVLAVVGASGSGKSSLVWAGLLPRLLPRLRPDGGPGQTGALPGSAHWRWARFTPQEEGPDDDPFRALARALAKGEDFSACRFETKSLAERLQGSTDDLAVVVEEALAGAPQDAKLLLFIDQFEEVFSLPDKDLRAFAALLAAGIRIDRLRLILTMRNEFAGRVAEIPALAELFNQGVHWLLPPDRQARREMILGPARRAGLKLEGGDNGRLVQHLIDDTGDEPGALPLMAFALEKLFQRDGATGELTLASYQAFGGVPGAVAQTAEAVFTAFAEQRDPAALGRAEQQDEAAAADAKARAKADAEPVLGALFAKLVDVRDAVAPPTRRRADRASLSADNPEAAELAQRFEAERLLISDRDIAAGAAPAAAPAKSDRAVVEVAHEALLTRWQRLRDWIEARRDQFWLRDRLRRDTADWQAVGCPTKLLPSAERARDLHQAKTVLGEKLTDAERAFLEPRFRAGWLLALDLEDWQAAHDAGASDADHRLWSADRFRGFADIESQVEVRRVQEDADNGGPDAAQSLPERHQPLLPHQTPAERAFLRSSFERAIAAPELHERPKLRAALGNALANLGDPRFDPAHWWLPDDATLGFRRVRAGRFLMGSPRGEGWNDEWDQHPLDLPELWIARWPVTVAQYRAFVEATGHDAEPASLDARASHPVVLVSWHDARAYAEWLGGQMQGIAAACLDHVVDDDARAFWRAVADATLACGLPSEAEWEKAARGTDGRRYPFGKDITPALANYRDTRLEGPSAVGCFPAGAGPYGCEEQAGNVWEWTRSLWGEDLYKVGYGYPYRRDDGRESLDAGDDVLRVLRGGAFGSDLSNCRSAVRYRYYPNDRDTHSGGGVRVVWSPFL